MDFGRSEQARELRNSLGAFATGVTIITAVGADGRPLGLTANSFASVSLDPPLVLWNMARDTDSFPQFESAPHFGINILSADQKELSRRFSAPVEDRFDGVPWHAGTTGVPLIDGSIAHLECDTFARHEGGDHLIIVGRVTRHVLNGGRPLIFLSGDYFGAPEA